MISRQNNTVVEVLVLDGFIEKIAQEARSSAADLPAVDRELAAATAEHQRRPTGDTASRLLVAKQAVERVHSRHRRVLTDIDALRAARERCGSERNVRSIEIAAVLSEGALRRAWAIVSRATRPYIYAGG